MRQNRLEAFSDGVIAIIITIMVLELKVPHEATWEALKPVVPVILSYILSFIFVAIYWNNHHHLLHTVRKVNGPILWANMHLLFWLSLIPFTTGFMGENHFETVPVVLYGSMQLMSGVAYYMLVQILLRFHGQESALAKALNDDIKGKISLMAYAISLPLAFINPWIALTIYVLVSLMWIIPDRRIEAILEEEDLSTRQFCFK